MQFKYSVNGLDLTDTVGLESYAPRFFLDAGTTRPSGRTHKTSTVPNLGSGSSLVGTPRSTSSLVTLRIAVTSFGEADTPEANFAANAAMIEGIFLEDDGFPVLRYFPEKDMEELITTADKYYGARAVVKSASWSASLNDSDWEYYNVILEVPEGYLYGEWKRRSIQAWAGESTFTATFPTPYSTFIRDHDWILTLTDFGSPAYISAAATVKLYKESSPEDGITLTPPVTSESPGYRLTFFSEYAAGVVGNSADIPDPSSLIGSASPVTEDDYAKLVSATTLATGESFGSSGSFHPNSSDGNLVVATVGLSGAVSGYLYYRERI